MILSQISINRPVLATVLNLIIILLGIISYKQLSVREYPNIDEPAVTVTTLYPGANAPIMESQVTQILEDSLAGIEGIKLISSISREGTSVINILFSLSRDSDNAAADVRDRVSRARGALPDEIEEPVVAKVEADAEPIMWITMRSDQRSSAELSDMAERYVQDLLQTVDGVSQVFIFGKRRYAMRIWIDPLKLAAHQLTLLDIENAIKQQNNDIPSGRIEGTGREFTVLANTDINSQEDFKRIIIANRNGSIIQMKDVARVTLGVEDDRVTFRYNGKNAVGLGIVKQAVSNPLSISRDIRALLPTIQNNMPKDIYFDIGYDSSEFIDRSLKKVYHTLIEAMVLVSAVIFLFLKSYRATLIPLVTIPISLIGSFALMSLLGFTINTLTLLAIVLAIGLVVDDAIVMLENIYRHLEKGLSPKEAAKKGADEIGFAIIAMTITLAAVYLPVLFMEGRTGKLFVEFAVTLACTVMISGFVALTLSPMMAAHFLNIKDLSYESAPKFLVKFDILIKKMEEKYQILLTRILKIPFVYYLLFFIFIGSFIALLLNVMRTELSPTEDRGVIFIPLIGPEGATSDYMATYALQVEEALKTIPEANRYGVVTGIGTGRLPLSNQGIAFVRFTPWEVRERSSAMISGSLFGLLSGVPGFLAFPILPGSLGSRAFGKPIEFVIKDNGSYDYLNEMTEKFLNKIRENPAITGIDTDLKMNTPQLYIDIDRKKLADLGISVLEVGKQLESLFASRQVTRFKYAGEQYDVRIAIEESLRQSPEQLSYLFIRNSAGNLIPLSNVITITPMVAPRDLNHVDRMRAVTITANVDSSYSIGKALQYMEETAKEILPKSAVTAFNGQSREYKESSNSLYIAFLLAILFIYLVLAAQFESFIDPFTILFTVPLSIIGALLTLFITGNSLNIYSQIGLITLIGLITKHGILIVEFANQYRSEHYSPLESVIAAATLRLRPILMTTAATILGALPLALADGAGAESRHQLGWVIVGGMVIGTVFSLIIIPYVYLLTSRWRKTA
jgi:multidrug efflux pump